VFSYDANGNIITQLRNGTAASGLSMDNLQYNYYTSTGSTYNPATATPTNATNKLAYVDDSGTPGNYTDDLEDQSAGNYTYDATGQLTSDAAEQIANIEWTVYGKIKNITRTASSTKKELTFKYDALGQRVMKLAKDRDASGVMTQENWTYTYYVRDAQGNVMATYKRSLTADINTQLGTDKLVLEESHIYGSSRLGIDDRETENINSTNTFAWSGNYTAEGELIPAAVPVQSKMAAVNVLTPKRKLGLKLYELSNHLGNVLVTVSDRKLTKQLGSSASVEFYMADVRSTSDYSAFGAGLAGRTFTSASGKYRYDFNGKETDVESDLQDYGMRIYNARLGKFLSVDPIAVLYPFYSPYHFAGNKPIWAVDLDGLEPYFATDGRYIGWGPNKNDKRIRVITAEEADAYKNDVFKIHDAIQYGQIDFRFIPKYVEATAPDGSIYYTQMPMTIHEFLNQAHIIYGEGRGTDAKKLAHLIWNREIKFSKLAAKARKTQVAYKVYGNETNNDMLKLIKKYGLYNWLLYGMHKPYDEKALEKYKKTLEEGSPMIDGGVENKNYSNFFKYKNDNDVAGLIKSIPISKDIFREIIQARLDISVDPNPNKDSWKGNGTVNTPGTELPGNSESNLPGSKLNNGYPNVDTTRAPAQQKTNSEFIGFSN
jgi:RHS repeat-associated protein